VVVERAEGTVAKRRRIGRLPLRRQRSAAFIGEVLDERQVARLHVLRASKVLDADDQRGEPPSALSACARLWSNVVFPVWRGAWSTK
jgi:hypothetical protein